MPYNGAGVFTRNYNWVNDRNSAIPITASRMDADSNDFASGLSSVVTRDGQGPVTSKIVVNGVGATPFIGAGMSDTLSTFLLLNKHGSGHTNAIFGCNDGLLRWHFEFGNTLAESGGNSGSDWALNRYSDAGNYIDSPIIISRGTGLVTINSLNVIGGISAPISATNITASGTLTIGGTSNFTGGATFHASQGVSLNVAAGALAEYVCVVAGQRTWAVGEYVDGRFRISDYTAGLERLTINSAGLVTIGGALTVSGTFNIATTMLQTVAGANYAIIYNQNGVRSWWHGVDPSGNWNITDNSAGIIRFTIDTAGHCTVNGALTCNSNFNTNQINGTIIIASTYFQVSAGAGNAYVYLTTNARQYHIRSNVGDGFLYFFDDSAGALRFYLETGGRVVFNNNIFVATGITSNAGTNTFNGQINCNAISCSTINTNNNGITMAGGGITCGPITAQGVIATASSLQANVTGNAILQLLSQGVRNWQVRALNNGSLDIADISANAQRIIIDTGGTVTIPGQLTVGSIDPFTCTGDITVQNGVNYAAHGAHTMGFTNSGNTLFFYAAGGVQGASWTFNAPSDERIKENIGDPEGDALDELRRVRLISFDETKMRDPEFQPTHVSWGFSAQKMLAAIPEAVTRAADPHRKFDTGGEMLLIIDIMPLLARCVGAIQQLSDRIETLERRL